MRHQDKRCEICAHYDPSPLKGKGWCRHPKFGGYAVKKLVRAKKLECGHLVPNYWTAQNGTARKGKAEASGEN